MFVIDRGVGVTTEYLNSHAKGGSTERLRYIVHESQDDTFIFGSSRAVHHYDPNILADSLDMTVYNCGFDGCGIITAYGLWRAISKRHIPKMIIYEVTPEFDWFAGDDHKYMNVLKDFYDCPGVDSLFWAVDKTERVKMMSKTYRVNSKFIEKVRDNVRPPRSFDKGYDPRDRMMDHEPKAPEMKEHATDPLKQYYLEQFVKECRHYGVELVLTCSPYYSCIAPVNAQNLVYAEELCGRYGVHFLNHSADTAFVNRRDFFYDGVHMNRSGATEYTKAVASEMKGL